MPGETELEQWQEEARRARTELAETQQLAHLGSWHWDIRRDVITWSDELFRIYGHRPGEFVPNYAAVRSRIHPDDRDRVVAVVQDGLRHTDNFEFVTRIVRATGEVGWTHDRGHVERDAAGTPVRMVGTTLDITAMKHTEEALRETSARYRMLQRMAVAANQASEMEQVLTTAVGEVRALTAGSAGGAYVLTGHAWRALPVDGGGHLDQSTVDDLLMRVLDTAAAAWRAAPQPAPPYTGGRGTLACPVLVAGQVLAALVFTDAEAALRDAVEQVATQVSRVAERARILAELAAARDAAMESSRLKSDFLATMSHEIRTPMNGVIGLTGLLLGTELTPRQRDYADGVAQAGEALLGIINDILDFSKIEAGKLELEVTDFDLVAVVESAADLLAAPALAKDLELAADCQPDLPRLVRGDPGRLRQVLLNLGGNAVKFTESGEVVIRVTAERVGDGEILARFEVRDTGIGIAPHDQERLFGAFLQADASTTRRYGGTGLGLAISRRLVTAMGGQFGVDSEPGRGSTFWFTVPLPRQQGPAAVTPPGQPPGRLPHDLPVLVVDDNATNQLILRDLLIAWQLRPTVVGSGPQALDALRRAARAGDPFPLVLLDMCMPDMDGLELARRITADPHLAGCTKILLTSLADIDTAQLAEAGIDRSLTKPLRQAQLYDCLLGATAARSATHIRPAPARAPAVPDRGHVLLVEDNTINQMVARGIMENLGYRVDVAATGVEALHALAGGVYAAVLMDCQMPVMDGYQATAEIRRDPGPVAQIPIIAMTASAVTGDRERALAAGMDDYLTKPIDPQALAAALDKWVPQHQPPAAAQEEIEEVIDANRLAMLRQLNPADPTLVACIVDIFLADAPSLLARVREAVDAGDPGALRQAAHQLCGAAGNVGATAVAARTAELEALGASGRTESAGPLVARLAAALDRTGGALRAEAGVPG